VSSDGDDGPLLPLSLRADFGGGLFGASSFVDGHCHASGGRQESDCGSLGRKTMSVFAVPVRDGSVTDSSVMLSFGIGNSRVEVVGDLLCQDRFTY
jgi:hypothetical protein